MSLPRSNGTLLNYQYLVNSEFICETSVTSILQKNWTDIKSYEINTNVNSLSPDNKIYHKSSGLLNAQRQSLKRTYNAKYKYTLTGD